jgi:hypothetical protein
VAWIAPQSEPVLVQYYRASDFVLDQFILGVFGLITPKALSCGAVVLTSYDDAPNAWCFAEPPPVVHCRTEHEIVDAVAGLAANPERRRALSQRSRQWVLRHHAKGTIVRILDAAMESARADFASRAR